MTEFMEAWESGIMEFELLNLNYRIQIIPSVRGFQLYIQ